jgi:hypothetical protein
MPFLYKKNSWVTADAFNWAKIAAPQTARCRLQRVLMLLLKSLT